MSDNGNIDVTIPGSVSSVDNAARYLENLRDDASDGSGMLNRNAVTSGMGGETALAVGAYQVLYETPETIFTPALRLQLLCFDPLPINSHTEKTT